MVLTYLLAAATGIHLVSWGVWFGLSKSDWGTWVGSIGTVLTLAGTIWIATDTARQRRKEQIDLAVIYAAQFSLQIRAMQGALQSSVNVLPACLDVPDPRPALKKSGDILGAATMWTSSDLVPLVVVPDHAAARLAFLKVRIENTILTLSKAGTSPQPFPRGSILAYYQKRQREIFEAKDGLEAPLQACLDFLKQHGFED